MLAFATTVLALVSGALDQVLSLPYPEIDPVAFQIGEKLTVRWYSLAYIGGLLSGWYIAARMARAADTPYDRDTINELPTWVLVGIVAGGRLGYVLFYNLSYYLDHPNEILAVWDGGMSFHGGFLGVILGAWLFARIKKLPFLSITDVICLVSPIGLMLGRLANFINGELFGRVTDSKMGMIFPNGGPYPRHPSQLYEAVLEGALLLTAMVVIRMRTRGKVGYGFLSGVFVVGYGIARTVAEFFREPDAQLGFLLGIGITMGQILSIPMIIAGVLIARSAMKKGPPPTFAKTEKGDFIREKKSKKKDDKDDKDDKKAEGSDANDTDTDKAKEADDDELEGSDGALERSDRPDPDAPDDRPGLDPASTFEDDTTGEDSVD